MLQVLRGLGFARLAVLGGVSLAVLVSLLFLAGRLSQGPMALLYGGLDLQDSAQIVSRLEGMKVPFELRGNGTQIMVPEQQALRLRMALAQEGLPTGGSIGYEIFDRANSLGTTNFVQNINHLRALEGELARTIRAIDGVTGARVHLVLPKREVFSRDNREPSASIVLKMRGVGLLDRPQVAAIQHLVAAAVPDLKPSRISLVDDKGNLLARGGGEAEGTGTPNNLAEMRLATETRLKRAVEALLEQSVGPGNVRAEVTAEIDFDRVTTNEELFDPDSQVVRSTQTITEEASASEQEGLPVTVASNLPDAQTGDNNNRSTNITGRSEETVNYEISKTIRTQVREAGLIRRLSVAVLVNGATTVNADGGLDYAPREPAELDQLTALVRSAIGFDAERGDTVEVVNMRFASLDEPLVAETEFNLLGLGRADLFRLAEMLVLGVVALLVLLLFVRPLLSRLLAPPRAAPPQPAAGAAAAALALPQPDGSAPPLEQLEAARNNLESMIDLARVEGQVKASSIKKIGEIVDKHPEEAVAIMRSWLYQNA